MANDNLHYVMHAHEEEIHLQLDDHWYHIPPNEPFEVNDGPFYVGKLLEIYQPVYGLINVPYSRTRTGLTIDVPAAQKEAERVLDLIEDQLVVNYAQSQLEERVKIGLPVLPPASGSRVAQIIKKNGIDLKERFNLVPVGTDSKGKTGIDPRLSSLETENASLRNQLMMAQQGQNEQNARFEALEAMVASLADGKKGK